MYKLLVIFVISIFVALGLGVVIGENLGEARTLVGLEVPDYCSVSSNADGNAITCSELSENVTAADICAMLDTPVKESLKILIVA
ncbi:hypothetical protein HOH11_02750 [Candidatus Woesearchaeota archaeon]|nr:hypothetical protein [Candidatus Woesearchaeota archaeon]